jgi:hypothetical protein
MAVGSGMEVAVVVVNLVTNPVVSATSAIDALGSRL